MTARLVITRGLPGSGKTTWARQQTGLVRVNRDDLRRMLDGCGFWIGIGSPCGSCDRCTSEKED